MRNLLLIALFLVGCGKKDVYNQSELCNIAINQYIADTSESVDTLRYFDDLDPILAHHPNTLRCFYEESLAFHFIGLRDTTFGTIECAIVTHRFGKRSGKNISVNITRLVK